jgi:CRP-like cAMP-binding protein
MADNTLASSLTIRINAGDFLFHEGDSSRDLYIVKFGKMRIFKTESGMEIDLAMAGPGMVVGEVAAIDNGNRSASCVAIETTELLVVPVDDFKRIMVTIPDWFRKIANILVQRLRDVDKKIHRAIGGDCIRQIAWLLAHICYSPLVSGDMESGMKISRKTLENELVDVLQVQLPDVSSALVKLQQMDLIAFTNDQVQIRDLPGLQALGASAVELSGETLVV